ncbi:MAG: hypothetical protein DRO40_11135, partial [Thermoprotei archaeon]
MKVVVGHHLWSRVGGGEMVSSYVVKTLLEAGYDVSIVSTVGFDKEKYKEWFDIDISGVKVYSLLPRMVPFFGIYQRLGFYIPLKRAINVEKPDVVFLDNEFYKPILKCERTFKIIEYIHFPFHAIRFAMGDVPEEYMEIFRKYTTDIWGYHIK